MPHSSVLAPKNPPTSLIQFQRTIQLGLPGKPNQWHKHTAIPTIIFPCWGWGGVLQKEAVREYEPRNHSIVVLHKLSIRSTLIITTLKNLNPRLKWLNAFHLLLLAVSKPTKQWITRYPNRTSTLLYPYININGM